MPQIVIRMNSVFAIISSFIPHAAISAATGGSTKKTLLDVNEFYQKGCQEKSSASTGGEMFSRDPAHWN